MKLFLAEDQDFPCWEVIGVLSSNRKTNTSTLSRDGRARDGRARDGRARDGRARDGKPGLKRVQEGLEGRTGLLDSLGTPKPEGGPWPA